MKCANCPVADGICLGESASRMCELMDPGHPAHDPRYGPILVERAAYPSAAQMARNLAGSFWDWATSGFKMASEEEVVRRLAICVLCPQWDDGRCRICGCVLAYKVRLRTEHCPLPEPRW